MFKKILFLSCCCFLPIYSYANNTSKYENLQVGRYQMVSATLDKGSVQLYLLDTATGYVWRSKCSNWLDTTHDSWKLQIGKTPR